MHNLELSDLNSLDKGFFTEEMAASADRQAISYAQILEGLKELGLREGDKVLVHSSISSFGKVDGGAETVIRALLSAVGTKGLVVMPTFGTIQPFDRHNSSTNLGIIAENFWRHPDAVRSLHPTHSVAAIGMGAEGLIKGHETAPTPYAHGTPYYRLASSGGKILLMGVDQDRNTTLHTAEALAEVPYLDSTTGVYLDDDMRENTIAVNAMAGPHRNFIGLDHLFRERGIMNIGRIGNSVCRLMDAGEMLNIALEALKANPAAVLCDNPSCKDCVMQKARIKRARLADETFTLAAVASDISDDIEEIIDTLTAEGITALEITADEYTRFGDALTSAGVSVAAITGSIDDNVAALLAERLEVPLIVRVSDTESLEATCKFKKRAGCRVFIENTGSDSSVYQSFYEENPDGPKLAFNPGHFALAGENPFLKVFYRGTLRRQTAHFYIDDRTFSGRQMLPGMGNAEVKEIISILRCRCYSGVITLRTPSKGKTSFQDTAEAFWQLLGSM